MSRALEASSTPRAALGLRAHSGWAALVVVAGPRSSPAVVDRRRIELIDPAIPGSKQPYHAAESLPLKQAEELVKRCADTARLMARQALRAVIDEVRETGHRVVGCGILLGSGRPLTSLAATLASHALIHTAEGELFRDALAHASERCDLRLTRVREREVYAQGAAALSIPVDQLERRVAELGKLIGPPWQQDQKCAALAAWLALAAAAEG
ncbi:MAG: hypothetical protein DMG24_01550 [Acidobacteria bacterium]|nr:MAG: hypothetical protein DMG24_01550 [Acidobacteriota bacterium]